MSEQQGNGKPQIPKDAIKIGKHAYYVYFGPVNQAQAVDECKKLGGYLAQITDQKEFEKFHKLLLTVKKDAHFWIDGTDDKAEGSWTFLDGSPLQQPLPWHTGEPNNGGRRRNQDGLAIQVKKIGKEWDTGMDDLEQAVPAGFICEWDVMAP